MNEFEVLKYIDNLCLELVNANEQLAKINYYLENKDNDKDFFEIEKKYCEERIKTFEISSKNAMELVAVYFNKGEEWADRFKKYIIDIVEIYNIKNEYKDDNDTTFCELKKAYHTLKNGGEND